MIRTTLRKIFGKINKIYIDLTIHKLFYWLRKLYYARKKLPIKIYYETQSNGFSYIFFLEFSKFHSSSQ